MRLKGMTMGVYSDELVLRLVAKMEKSSFDKSLTHDIFQGTTKEIQKVQRHALKKVCSAS